ncbi:MAG: GTPase HflX [bacterium]
MKGLLVVLEEQDDRSAEIDLAEMLELCRACQIEVTQTIIQHAKPSRPYYIGKGKVQEVREALDEEEVVIFNNELSPLQVNNLYEMIQVEIIDRTDLILKIFESRAATPEAKLQVKIAKLRYELPRLAHWKEELYSQQGGSGFRGAGEKQIELDRRRIRHSITRAKEELAKIRQTRANQRRKRRKHQEHIIALVGYTNAGKSTLLNYYTPKQVYSEDMLFATLETTTRQVMMKNHKLLMIDTVGFISRLPHHLVEAFKSTLEEVCEADLILEVIDASAPDLSRQIETTRQVLTELGVTDTPILYVYNKIDLMDTDVLIPLDPYVMISLKEERGIEALEDQVIAMLEDKHVRLVFQFPYSEGAVYQKVRSHVHVIQEEFRDDGIILIADAPPSDRERYQAYLMKKS